MCMVGGMTSAQHSEQGMREFRVRVADLAETARCLDYYAKVSERFGKPEWFYSVDG